MQTLPIAFAILDIPVNKAGIDVDVNKSVDMEWVSHVHSSCYQGQWDVLPLKVPAEHVDAHVILQAFAIEGNTTSVDGANLQYLPAINTLLQQFKCNILSARLMRLAPNAYIKPHCDAGLSIEISSQARLHIPLQTNELVEFYVNDQRIPMTSETCWYINADAVHSVKNLGEIPRINLIIDCEVNDWLREKIIHSPNKTHCLKRAS